MTNREIVAFFKQKQILQDRFSFDQAFKLLQKDKGNTTFTQLIWKTRPAKADVEKVIKKEVPPGEIRQTALLYAIVVEQLRRLFAQRNGGPHKALFVKTSLAAMKTYNRYVQSIGRANLTIDTAKSIAQSRVVPKS